MAEGGQLEAAGTNFHTDLIDAEYFPNWGIFHNSVISVPLCLRAFVCAALFGLGRATHTEARRHGGTEITGM